MLISDDLLVVPLRVLRIAINNACVAAGDGPTAAGGGIIVGSGTENGASIFDLRRRRCVCNARRHRASAAGKGVRRAAFFRRKGTDSVHFFGRGGRKRRERIGDCACGVKEGLKWCVMSYSL